MRADAIAALVIAGIVVIGIVGVTALIFMAVEAANNSIRPTYPKEKEDGTK